MTELSHEGQHTETIDGSRIEALTNSKTIYLTVSTRIWISRIFFRHCRDRDMATRLWSFLKLISPLYSRRVRPKVARWRWDRILKDLPRSRLMTDFSRMESWGLWPGPLTAWPSLPRNLSAMDYIIDVSSLATCSGCSHKRLTKTRSSFTNPLQF